ncbi:glycine oxidase [Magnetococcus marinus MC-1]|uniref:Glycine oxidase n=1 Tax=Magnetococcus marinus (strain ATCC BAA-1437 / JCM 17883 / MC-1) TaxID=156889 RepID=A0LBT1_MAGMM|nr:glycine oxidase ThiO [Magnetococcus marinus]ABK45424.1 glycine oxidase [Magnetococcus marinus MC-1]
MEHVVIVGAGVMGTACAFRLLEQGYRVTLLEKALPGAESSAAAAGILGAQSEVSGGGAFLDLCVASRGMFRDFVGRLQDVSGVHCGYEESGVLEVAMDPAEGRLAAGRAEWMLERDLRVEILDRDEARRLEPALSERIIGANFYPDDHQVEPVALSRALAAAVARLGGQFRSGVQVTGLHVQGERVVGVASRDEVIHGDHVIIAGGAWSSMIGGLPPLRTQVKPMSGQILQVEMRPPAFRHVVYGYKGYIVPRADGRVVMGSTLEDRGFDKAVTTEGLQRITQMALEMVPLLKQARMTDAWAGLRPATGDGHPLLGQGPWPGLYFATGHYRNGILMTPITAEVTTQFIMGQVPPWDLTPFTPIHLMKEGHE